MSLLDCQLQLKLDQEARLKGNRNEIENENDYICSVCQYGGELVLCDNCPSSFHTSCIGLQEVPDGEWFCPSCCCRICNENRFSGCYEQNSDSNILSCKQCEKRYHLGCLKRREDLSLVGSYHETTWFCCLKCEEILMGLERLLGKSIPVGRGNLTWTLRKYKAFEFSDNDASDMEELIENYSKLNVAISVMHECFEPVKEARTGRDIVEDVVLCRRSELPRLNFNGVYTVLLEKDDELISTAVVRIYGDKVAEVPLVGTRVQYRRRGMCRMLMHQLEKQLTELGVRRLVLPAVSSVLHAWIRSFGFSVMSESEKLNFLGYTFLDFQGTTMCHKFLVTGLPFSVPSISTGNSRSSIINLGSTSDVLEESLAEKINESRMVEQTPSEHKKSSILPHEILMNQLTRIERESETNLLQCSTQTSNPRETKDNVDAGFFKCYQRRRFKPVRVEVSFQK
uniref:increased DNA methylation 1-like n=1 Tax=Erigeron canadensis TaxID=72917 RepID=UPI001CB94A6C|nr:increased DNA methylation 1-like [Erigeron canadensis]